MGSLAIWYKGFLQWGFAGFMQQFLDVVHGAPMGSSVCLYS